MNTETYSCVFGVHQKIYDDRPETSYIVETFEEGNQFDPVTDSGTSYITEGNQEAGRVLINTKNKALDKTGEVTGYDSDVDAFEDTETQEWLRRRSPECGDYCEEVNENLVDYLPQDDNPWPHHSKGGLEGENVRHPVQVLKEDLVN